MIQLILGSSSPNRRALFDQLGVAYSVENPAYEEVIDPKKTTTEQVQAFSLGKAKSILKRYDRAQNILIIGFDSMICFQGKSIGKAKDEADMIETILSFAGQPQQVMTGMTVLGYVQGEYVERTVAEVSDVTFRSDMTRADLQQYARFGDWSGKCGSYSILGTGIFFLDEIRGSFQNIVGVPVITMRRVIEDITGQNIFSIIRPKTS